MISEVQWRVIKHDDLASFNRPRLDLVIHTLVVKLIPRVEYNISTLLGQRRQGHIPSLLEWQKDLKHQWHQLSKPDEQRNIEQQLTWLRAPAKTAGRQERLVLLEADAQRQPGEYHTNMDE